MQKRKKSKQSQSLKTFLIYSYLVAFLVLASLAVKTFFIFRENKYHAENIAIAVSDSNQLRAVIGVDKEKSDVTVLRINNGVSVDSAWYELGILTDASISINDDVSKYSPEEIIKKTFLNPGDVKTNLTYFDTLKLLASSKIKNYNPENDFTLKKNEFSSDEERMIKGLFSDSSIVADEATIQIINSTNVSGLGQSLEKALVSRGGTVVSVVNQDKLQKDTVIKSSLKDSYTVKKLESLFDIKASELIENSVADIIIIIGEDMIDQNI